MFRLCNSCSTLLDDVEDCPSCGEEVPAILDVLLPTEGKDFEYQQSETNPNLWFISRGSLQYSCTVKEDGTLSCSCTSFRYRKECKHATALSRHLNQEPRANIQYNIQRHGSKFLYIPKKKLHRDIVRPVIETLQSEVLSGLDFAFGGSYIRGERECSSIKVLVKGLKKEEVVTLLFDLWGNAETENPGEYAPDIISQAPIEGQTDKIPVKVYFTTSIEFSPFYLWLSSSYPFYQRLKKAARLRGYYLNRFGLWDSTVRSQLEARDAKDIFESLGIPFAPPRDRS